jgi:hypothetical protein
MSQKRAREKNYKGEKGDKGDKGEKSDKGEYCEKNEKDTQENKRFKDAFGFEELLDEFKCPIIQEPPVDPVVAEDGNLYECKSIKKWLETHNTSPMTNQPMGKKLVRVLQVRNTIESIMLRMKALNYDIPDAWKKKFDDRDKLKALQAKADSGETHAMYTLGCYYARIEPPNYTEALSWFERCQSNNDNKHAGCMLAIGLLLTGIYTNTDIEQRKAEGLILITQASMLGSGAANFFIGTMYEKGRENCKIDFNVAREWYEKSLVTRFKSGDTYVSDLGYNDRTYAENWLRDNPISE